MRNRVLSRYERGGSSINCRCSRYLDWPWGVFGWGWAVDQFGGPPAGVCCRARNCWSSLRSSPAWCYRGCSSMMRTAPRIRPLTRRSTSIRWPVRSARSQGILGCFILLPPRQCCTLRLGGRLGLRSLSDAAKARWLLIPVGLLLGAKGISAASDAPFERLGRRLAMGDQLSRRFRMRAAWRSSPCRWVDAAGRWALKPLPAGSACATGCMAAAKRLGFRCSNILLWNTRQRHGQRHGRRLCSPWVVRYVVFTDRFAGRFHAGRGSGSRHRSRGRPCQASSPDLLSRLFLTLEHGRVLRVLASLVAGAVLFHQNRKRISKMSAPLVALGLVPYIFVVFGFVSRRCGTARRTFTAAGPCAGAELPSNTSEGRSLTGGRRSRLCATGIRNVHPLEKVALVNGISRDRPGFLQSWQHSTIAKRVEFLQRVLDDRGVEPRGFKSAA